MSEGNTPIRILTYDAVYGLVDYGTVEYNPNINAYDIEGIGRVKFRVLSRR